MLPPRTLPLILLLLALGAAESQPLNTDAPRPEEYSPADAGAQQLPPPGHAWVIFESDTVLAEVARTPDERERGLMFRESLPDGSGMFFVFSDSQIRSFWMRNTFIPLDIAYMDADLRIVDIQSMDPETEETHLSARPAMFALEVPRGWFSKVGLAAGAQAEVVFGPGKAPAGPGTRSQPR